MIIDTLPRKFGEGLDYKIDRAFTKEGTFEGLPGVVDCDLNTPIVGRESLLKEIVGRIFRSLTLASLDDYIRLHILSPEQFLEENRLGKMKDYGRRIKKEEVGAFQCAYRAVLNNETPFGLGLLYAAHEIGGVIIPHEVKTEVTLEGLTSLAASAKTDSTFLLEVAQHFLQLATCAKWCVEKVTGMTAEHGFSVKYASPVHYTSIVEAARLLRNRTTPLREYGEYFEGLKKVGYSASIPDLSSGRPVWRNPKETGQCAGGSFDFRPIEFL